MFKYSHFSEHLSIGYIMILGNNSSVDALLQKRKERFVCSSNLFVYLMTIILIQKLEGIYPYVCF